MNSVNTSHPPLDRLVAFADGKLSEVESAAIGRHVKICLECVKQLEEIPEGNLAVRLRRPGSHASGERRPGGSFFSPPTTAGGSEASESTAILVYPPDGMPSVRT